MDRSEAVKMIREHAGSAWKEVKTMKWLTELVLSISNKERNINEDKTQRINELENQLSNAEDKLSQQNMQIEELNRRNTTLETLKAENENLREVVVALSDKHTRIKEKLADRAHQLKQQLTRTQRELRVSHERNRVKDRTLWTLTSIQKRQNHEHNNTQSAVEPI